MRTSVVDVTLKDCCMRTLRSVAQRLARAGVRRDRLALPPLARILNPDPSQVRTITLTDWGALAQVSEEVSDKAKDECGRAARLEVLRHGDNIGAFWRSFADCFR